VPIAQEKNVKKHHSQKKKSLIIYLKFEKHLEIHTYGCYSLTFCNQQFICSKFQDEKLWTWKHIFQHIEVMYTYLHIFMIEIIITYCMIHHTYQSLILKICMQNLFVGFFEKKRKDLSSSPSFLKGRINCSPSLRRQPINPSNSRPMHEFQGQVLPFDCKYVSIKFKWIYLWSF